MPGLCRYKWLHPLPPAYVVMCDKQEIYLFGINVSDSRLGRRILHLLVCMHKGLFR